MNPTYPTISQSIIDYIEDLYLARSTSTARTYRNALNSFSRVLTDKEIEPDTKLTHEIPEEAVIWFARSLKSYAPATERLYLINAVTLYYEYLASHRYSNINMHRVRSLIKQFGRRPQQRLPQFPREEIETIIDYAKKLNVVSGEKEAERLRNLRDRAFLLVLADTGLRVHEACALRRGDIDWPEGRAIIIGKGNQQAIVRFSSRSMNAIKDYLNARASKDGSSGRPLSSLPIFSRHDKGAGNKVLPITTTTGRNIVSQRVIESIGESAAGSITPHSFRHYFVTTVLLGSGGNLKLAQELARHKNIAVTQRYAHLADDELDRGYYEIFEE